VYHLGKIKDLFPRFLYADQQRRLKSDPLAIDNVFYLVRQLLLSILDLVI
jgi:hypothetical protein